ncbi:restriction endonuclease [Actinomadura logoneensis]|uniref:Restriction endonuclease n=1 Tax=Actinomadura logoneensis TaxID=2293572 RepID=A0A372JRF7_9ACTN|nr:NaeI family type II restriction endonuclease [Actinomadura logoneensis]RFU42344.1 restriction endonuclease [Actinomadura logoneensis]
MTEPLGLFGLPGPRTSDQEPTRPTSSSDPHDPALEEVCAWFLDQPRFRERLGAVLRQAIDEVLDGQRTGRFDIYGENVAKTERTYLGTKVEIICQSEFRLERGFRMDYVVAGHEVDAKFSMSSKFGQAIPKEAVGEICLLMHADDRKGVFNVALIRAAPDLLNKGVNQDGKRTLNSEGRARVRWLVKDGPLPENQLLRLPADLRRIIFAATKDHRAGAGGQERINRLFRLVQGVIIRPETIRTVANQKDPYKRPRDARLPRHLGREGILILGHQGDHPRIAEELGLPVPDKGEFVSVRVVPTMDIGSRPSTTIDGVHYTPAALGDPMTAAPEIY